MNRALLLEYFFRMAFYLFGNMLINKKARRLVDAQHPSKLIDFYADDVVSPSHAFYIFMEVRVKPYH